MEIGVIGVYIWCMKKEKQKNEKRERYQIVLLPSVKNKAFKKAFKERKSFSRLIENLLYDYSAE